MKTRISVLMIVAVVAVASIAIGAKEATIKKKVTKPMKLETEMQKVSYSIGTNLGNQFKQMGLELQYDAFVQGIKDVIADNELAISQQDMQTVMTAFGQRMQAKQAEMQKKMMEERDKMAPINAKEGAEFLAKNAKKAGVIVLPSGLQYKVIKKGKGPKLEPTDNFKAHYKGSFIDGTVFDSSEGRAPLDMPQTDVIAGWTEALKLMPAGSKWMLYVPGDLAYGVRGKGDIGPNTTLVFEMELLGPGEAKPAGMPPRRPRR